MARRRSRRAGQRSWPQRHTQEQVQIVEIETTSDDGRGIARLDGKVAFVAGALADERVTARIVGERRRFVEMRTLAVERPSPQRVEPRCPHYGVCGGCSLQHWRHSAQVLRKEAVVRRQLGLDDGDPRWQLPLVAGGWGYRWRARLALARGSDGDVVIGFRRGRSHRPAAIDVCPVLHPELEGLFPLLRELLAGISAAQRPVEVELALYEEAQARRAVTLWHFDRIPGVSAEQTIARWAKDNEIDAWVAGSQEPLSLCGGGDYTLTVDDGGLRIGVHPGDFSQVNVELNRALVARAVDWLDPRPDEAVADLFCGVGNFSLPLARRAASVIGVEQAPAMVERLQANAVAAGLNNVVAVCADLSGGLAGLAGERFDAVLLDPPRRGAQAVAAAIGRLQARRIVCVSCDPATLGRDAALITAQGYALRKACIADMFAQTAHTESLVLFERG